MNTLRRPAIRIAAYTVIALALIASACSKGGATTDQSRSPTPSPRPSSPAKLTILAPVNGAVIQGGTVSIRVKLQGAKIVPATTTHLAPTQGHLHVYVDNQIAGMNFKLTDDVTNVSPGMHVLRVEFVASDHLPWDPRIFSQVTFEVDA